MPLDATTSNAVDSQYGQVGRSPRTAGSLEVVRNPHLLARQARIPRATVADEIEARDGSRVAMRAMIERQRNPEFSDERGGGPLTEQMLPLAGNRPRPGEHRRTLLLQPAEPGEQQVGRKRLEEHGVAA